MNYLKPDSARCISMMTGTSMDGIDAILVDFDQATSSPTHQVIHAQHYQFSHQYKELAREVIESQNLQKAFYLGQCLSQEYARAALALLEECHTSPDSITFIAVSGHTIFHQPATQKQNGMTVDTTDLSMLAALTSIPTIGRFRQKDIAFGGQGAPLVPFAHPFIFGKEYPNSLVQNIGGIGNVTVLENAKAQLGFDTGPGNTWIDQTIKWFSDDTQNFDQDGAIASKGTADMTLVDELLMHRFFQEEPPKSTGIKTLGYPYLNDFKDRLMQLSKEDALATVTYATAKSIATAYQNFVLPKFNPSHVILCGGGAYNKTLHQFLIEMLPTIHVITSLDSNVQPEHVEAISFAYLGLFRWHHRPNVLAHITGSFKDNVGGEIAYAD